MIINITLFIAAKTIVNAICGFDTEQNRLCAGHYILFGGFAVVVFMKVSKRIMGEFKIARDLAV